MSPVSHKFKFCCVFDTSIFICSLECYFLFQFGYLLLTLIIHLVHMFYLKVQCIFMVKSILFIFVIKFSTIFFECYVLIQYRFLKTIG